MLFSLIIIQLFYNCLCFRSFKNQFNPEIFQRQCPGSHQYWPGIHPHMCAGYPRECDGTTELKQLIINDEEVVCHPQIKGYILYGSDDTHLLLGWWPYIMIYSYDQNGNLIFQTEAESQLYDNGCLIGQQYSGIYKCIYCSGTNYGENCASSTTALQCGQYCKTCDSTNTKCATCIDGHSKLSSTDYQCQLICQVGHKTCQKSGTTYTFNGCIDGYELKNGQCVQCPSNCKICTSGVCSQCMWPYSLENSLCFEDRNCMKYDYIYDSQAKPIGTNCLQCDVGYFKKGTRCASCQEQIGLEKCFICDNANECKGCFATHYLTIDKKCVLYTNSCNLPCQTCLVTDSNYCTTCLYQNKLTARIVPGKCVCDQLEEYADLNGQCILCNTGYCLTCTLKFGECTSCDPLLKRGLVGYTCPCLQGYYDTGLDDKICQKCYPSCYNCSGPYDTDCTDCGDPNIYYKQLISGKCICTIRTIAIIQSNGQTLCQSCHSKCEKCQFPYDNSSNQYCTMCITGQYRVVSDDFKCICKNGYGEDGIVDICFKCHYSCLSCNGPLSTNCTTCSSSNNRYLTSNNECLCNVAYYDTGKNDILCYLACHNSCVNCISAGEDKCTICPSTRYPDRIGSIFKCLCKDPHYYSDEFSLECLECHFTCKTCNGIKETNCLTCDLNYRQLIISKCDCPYGYYDIGQLQCQQCYYTCMTCFGTQINSCITCSDESNRIVKANKCVCKDGYIEKQLGDQICQKCSYRCSSCTVSLDYCDKCPESSFRDLGVDNSCLCPPKTYDQPDNPICIFCHSTCQTCNGNQSNQCTSCNFLAGRQLNNKGECLCASQYFDNGFSQCLNCSSLCFECKSQADNCTSCQPEKYLNGNTCICKTKLQGLLISTYLSQTKSQCQPCHYSCLTCTGRLSLECDSCLDIDNRIQQGTTCNCKTTYFDIGTAKCIQCNFRCQTCAVLDTLCITCPPLSLRILVNSQCLCQSGYYDNGINSICQKCHYSCLTCSQIATKCVTCSSSYKRQLNNILNSCICYDNYYDTGIENCQQCHYTCLNCQGQNSNQCKSCIDQNISFRVFNSGICQCLIGYYDDGISINCKKCHIQCITCQTQSYNCTSCPITRHLNGNKCDCDLSYYEIGLQQCSKCDQNCVDCTNTSTYCTKCDSNQLKILDNITHQCLCQIGTTDINGVCQYCDKSCKTCLTTIINCTSCGLMKQLINNKCLCIDGTYEIGIDKQCLLCNQTCKTCINQENYCLTCSLDSFRIFKVGNQCVCQDGYFENSINQCISCDQSCLTCQGNSTYCLSCDSRLNLQLSNQNSCICMSSYYFNIQSKQCEGCNITCKECQNVQKCIECEPITRFYDPDNFKCLCKEGYYEINSKMCQLCDLSCKTCINQSIKCLTCESMYYRIFNNNNQCNCLDGYYDVGIEMCQKCNNLCKTCQQISTKCLSCYDNEQIRILNNKNQCQCKSGYFDNGQLICEKCSKSCLTCQGKNDYCTSCDINLNRIDQSLIHKCPCQTNFYQDQDENCQKCHIKCSGCISQKDKCISCKTSNTSNRLSIISNCDCNDGYYDDGLQFQCQKCSYQCKTCVQSPSNCLICQSNLRQGIPTCNCKSGYFQNEQQTCESCENQCNTCEELSYNCTSCKGCRINKTCDCQDGYFEAGQPDCIICDYQCLTCKGNQSYCLQCKGDRINIPICNCQDGFYDDFQSVNCLKCDSYCKTCNLEGCLTCNGNRVLSEENTCDSPQNSVSHSDTPWCSTCDVAVLDIRFSDDLLSITVLFDFTLNPNYFKSQFSENICFKFLVDQTIKQLGKNPDCKLDQDNEKQLILNLGSNAAILPGDSIIFIDSYFGHKDCSTKLNQFILNKIQNPINPVSPIIEYDIPQYLFNPCDDNTILIKSKTYDGLRNLISITWSYLVEGQNGNGDLERLVQHQTNLQLLDLVIPIQTLPKQSKIIFFVEYQNFIKQKGQQQIQVQTHSGQLPTVLWLGKKQYYTFEIIDLQFTIQKKQCSNTTQIQNDKSQYSVSLIEIYRNNSNSRPSRVDVSQIINENTFQVTIEKYTLSPKTAYTFLMQTQEPQTTFSISQNITIEISRGGLLCQFIGTNKIQNYRKDSTINIQCKDLDTQYQWNEDTEITIEISCVDLTQNGPCKDMNNKIIQVNKTDSIQIIPKLTVKPYSIWSWTVLATKQSYQQQFKQNIVFLDNDFKTLDVQYSKGYTIRQINNYETLQFIFNIPFEDRYYLLQYEIAIIYNFELIKILEPQYYQYHFRLFDHYQQFNKGNQINFKFLVQFTNDIIPSQYDLQLTLNQPPICQIKLALQSVQALQTNTIAINCEIADDSPFTYQLRYFFKNQDYKDFQNQLSDYSLILNSFSKSNSFETYLPQSEGVTLIQIMDSRGSITNIESYLNITQFKLNCSNYQIENLIYKKQIMLLLEIMMNHYDQLDCIKLSEQLIKQIKTYLDSEDLFEQLLVLQTIKLYKRFIIDFNNLTSQTRKLTEINIESCYDNKTKQILINHSEIKKYSNNDISTFELEFSKLKKYFYNKVQERTNIEIQIKQNEIFMNELLFQSKEQIQNSLSVIILFIDDLLYKISDTSLKSDQDKNSIIVLSEKLINLIDDVGTHLSDQVPVNGQRFNLEGQKIKYQLSRITKNVFNQQQGLDKDLLDGLIVFVQKEQLDISFNYFNISNKHLQELKTFLNQSQLEIEQNYYTKTKLQNYLYQNQFIDYEQLQKDYLVDFTQYPYCVDTSLSAYNFQCVSYNHNGSLLQCNLKILEDNNSILLSCQCSQLGIIFLTRYQNLSESEQELNDISNIDQNKDYICNLSEQVFILFHGIYVVFSFFMYFELQKLDIPLKIKQNIITEQSCNASDQIKKNLSKLNKYQTNSKIFNFSIKFIHEIICLFYCDDQIIKKSYRFLKFSIFLSILIPLSYFETLFIEKATWISILIINYLILLLLRIVFKIFESIYRFQGIFKIIIIIWYFMIHLLSYILFVYLYKKRNECSLELNYNMSIIVGGTVLLSYAIFDPIFIYVRVIIYKFINSINKEQEFNPFIQLIYFFIQHYKLDQIFKDFIEL